MAFSQYISHTLSCLFEIFFFIHVTVRIFRMCESLKVTYIRLVTKLNYIFKCQQIWKIANIPGSSGHVKKYGSQYWSAKWALCKVQYFRRQWLTFSYILSGYLKRIINTECYLQYLPELPQQPDKKTKHGNEKLHRVSWYLHQIKKKAYINTVCTKSASKNSLNCFAMFGSSACLSWHVQLLDPQTK